MVYRAEIDGLRAVSVLAVIFYHFGFEPFSGGFIGVDVFFVISGYLITTLLINDLEHENFSYVSFYDRRIRRILPPLLTVLACTSIASYFILYPSDLEDYGKSLLSVLTFVSNIFFWRTSDYFATASELIPLLHTWSLSVEEQFYILWPICMIIFYKCRQKQITVLILTLLIVSFLISEWGWRNKEIANFYLLPTRMWELLVGCFAASVIQKSGLRNSEIGSIFGLFCVIFSILVYDDKVPFPSLFSAIPVIGALFIVFFATEQTIVGKILSNKYLVNIGLLSYSLYLWHQPVLAFYRRIYGADIQLLAIPILFTFILVASLFTWRFIEIPARKLNTVTVRFVYSALAVASVLLILLSLFFIMSHGARYQYDYLPKPERWSEIKCHGAPSVNEYDNPLQECLGLSSNSQGGDMFLIGDSHAAQLTFPLRKIAEERNVNFWFINTENQSEFPRSFWQHEIEEDPLLEHVLNVADPGDFFLVAFHRGRFNPSRDAHYTEADLQDFTQKSQLFHQNMTRFMPSFNKLGMKVIFINDGPLLEDFDTSIEQCMYFYIQGDKQPCPISFHKDNETRSLQTTMFNVLASQYDNVVTLDYLPILYNNNSFSPISVTGEYLMRDRHHLSEYGSLMLLDFFRENVK